MVVHDGSLGETGFGFDDGGEMECFSAALLRKFVSGGAKRLTTVRADGKLAVAIARHGWRRCSVVTQTRTVHLVTMLLCTPSPAEALATPSRAAKKSRQELRTSRL